MRNHPSTRREFLKHLGLGTACALAGTAYAQQPKTKPNIIHILIDDMGYADLGCYGNTFCETPNIDRLAAEGMRFTDAYAAAPICSASRAAFLTGKSPARLGFEFVTKYKGEDYASGWTERFAGRKLIPPLYTLNLPLEEETIAEAMKRAGYTTGMTGKWHVAAHDKGYLQWDEAFGPAKQGFDWIGKTFGSHPYGYTKEEKGKFGPYQPGEYPEDALTNGAIDFMRGHRGNPFFLFVSHFYVHVPLGTKCKWLLDKYENKAKGQYAKRRALYAAFIQTLDHYIGQLLDAIDELGLAENTIVVFTSDNGGHPEFAFNAPLRGSKWNLYEGGIRVPAMVRWPGAVEAGSQCHTPITGVDFLPTYCGIAGTTPTASSTLDGASILPLLQGHEPGALQDRSHHWHFPYYHPEKGFDKCKAPIGIEDGYVSQTRPQAALRKGNHKLIYFFEDRRAELYDLANDIGEQHDLAETMPAEAQALERVLLGYLEAVNARLPARKE